MLFVVGCELDIICCESDVVFSVLRGIKIEHLIFFFINLFTNGIYICT